jgi:hypothetical protein
VKCSPAIVSFFRTLHLLLDEYMGNIDGGTLFAKDANTKVCNRVNGMDLNT